MGRYSYKTALEVLKTYSKDEGIPEIDLEYDGISMYKFEIPKTSGYTSTHIRIQNTLKYEYMVYVFLHELGHYILRRDYEAFKKRFPNLAKGEYQHQHKKGRKYTRRINYVVECLEEEYMAWHEGLELGKRLGIRINMTNWDYYKTTALKGYMDYYSKQKR